jgi:hypothetical protein
MSAPPWAAFFAKYFVSKAVNIAAGAVKRIQYVIKPEESAIAIACCELTASSLFNMLPI